MPETAVSENCISEEILEKYLSGWLNEPDSQLVESHLVVCSDCESKIKSLEAQVGVDPLLQPVANTVEKNADMLSEVPRRSHWWDRNHPWQPALPSPQLGPYELLEPLGNGGMGFVYLAKHTRLDRSVAIKLLPAYCQSDFANARFEREIAAVGRLQHPSIVAATDAGQADGMMFLVMEYVRGLDLAKLSRLVPNMSIEDICEMARQVAMGLSYAHAAGMVHRDIKPSNLMLDESGAIKILDFGLVQLDRWDGASSELTTVGQFLGTLDYMAPEQAVQSGSVDYRADLYALGATMFKLLCGRGPLSATPNQSPMEKLRILSEHRPPSLKTLRPDAPEALVQIVNCLLSANPQERPASAAHLAEALAPLAMHSRLVDLLNQAKGVQSETLPNEQPKPEAQQAPVQRHDHNPLQLANSPLDRATRGSRRIGTIWKGIAVACFLPIAALAAYALVLETSKGQLIIESEIPGIRVRIKSSGMVAKTLDINTGNTATKLSADRYDIELEGASDSISIDRSTITIRNHETVIARIREVDNKETLSIAPSPTPEPLYEGKNLAEWMDTFHRENETKTWREAVVAIGKLVSREKQREMYGVIFDKSIARNDVSALHNWHQDELMMSHFVELLRKTDPNGQLRIANKMPSFENKETYIPFWDWLVEQEKQGSDTTSLLVTREHLRFIDWLEFIDKSYPLLGARLDWFFLTDKFFYRMMPTDNHSRGRDYLVSKSLAWLEDPNQTFANRVVARCFLQPYREFLTDEQIESIQTQEVKLIEDANDHRRDFISLSVLGFNYVPESLTVVAALFKSISDNPWTIGNDKIWSMRLDAIYLFEKATREEATATWNELQLGKHPEIQIDDSTFEAFPRKIQNSENRYHSGYVLHRYALKILYGPVIERITRRNPQITGEEIDAFKALDTNGDWRLTSDDGEFYFKTIALDGFLDWQAKEKARLQIPMSLNELDPKIIEFAKSRLKKLDKNNDGFLSPDEFKQGDFQNVDLNRDGKIDLEEYATFMVSR